MGSYTLVVLYNDLSWTQRIFKTMTEVHTFLYAEGDDVYDWYIKDKNNG